MKSIHFGRRGIVRIALSMAAAGLVLSARPGDDRAPTRSALGGSMADPASPRGGGSLVIGGGGRLPDSVYHRFLELAGGKESRIVLIPTARWPGDDGADPTEELESWKALGIASVGRLHTRSRAKANDPAFAAALLDATGVWIGGGVQARLSDVYAGTEVERQLGALLGRGGVIGGSSAGAAIMTRVMIVGGRVDAVEGRGFDLLPGAIVDQHFLKRNRIGRLTRLLERHPELVGFGIDEGTALVVDVRERRVGVVGDSDVVACVPASGGRPARTEVLKPGDRADLATLGQPRALEGVALSRPSTSAPLENPTGPLSPPDGPGRSR